MHKQTENSKDGEKQKLTAKEILKEQWFLTTLCFHAAPRGMAFHIFESVKLRVSIFFEFIWMINYTLGIAERGGPWKQFFWCMVLFMMFCPKCKIASHNLARGVTASRLLQPATPGTT